MSLKLLVGLGNPGEKYDRTRHNAGFMMLDRLAIKYGAEFSSSTRLQGLYTKLKAEGRDLLLLKPMTYMNLSGRCVQAAMAFFKVEKNNLLVAHDEVALPMGVIRLARGGGSAGNHGIESIMYSLGHKDFQRLRMGVGPDPGGAVRADFVLSKIDAKDELLFFKTIDLSLDAAEHWLKEGIQSAMNKYNGIDLSKQEPL